MKNYLPSKKFTNFLIGILILGVIFLILFSVFSSKKSFKSKNNAKINAENLTLNQLLQKDGDGDGVYDWEEALWGTEPNKKETFEGIPDKIYIENKRKDLKATNPDGSSGIDPETETAKFARQFFASIAAMKQTGQIDQETINNVSNSLGQGIVNPNLTDAYTLENITISKGDSVQDQEDYYVKAAKLFEKYKKNGIGDELEIIGGMASTGRTDKASSEKLSTISGAYQSFAKNLSSISVPESLKNYHVEIINNSNNTGIAVKNMIKITDDPLVGLTGLSEYQKYSENLVSSVQNLETFLSVNDIINE